MKNEYEIRGEETAIFIKSKKYGNLEALISTDKLELMKEVRGTWSVSPNNDGSFFYIKSYICTVNRKKRFSSLHRFVTQAPTGYVVDHINHDTLNNTNNNLRILSQAENVQNLKESRLNNTSGIRGVSWKKDVNKWVVQLGINNKHIYIGLFENIVDAENARLEAAKKYLPYSQEYKAM